MPIGPCIIIILEFFFIIAVQLEAASYYSRHDPALPLPLPPPPGHLAGLYKINHCFTLYPFTRVRNVWPIGPDWKPINNDDDKFWIIRNSHTGVSRNVTRVVFRKTTISSAKTTTENIGRLYSVFFFLPFLLYIFIVISPLFRRCFCFFTRSAPHYMAQLQFQFINNTGRKNPKTIAPKDRAKSKIGVWGHR